MGEELKRMKAKVIHKYEYEKDWLRSNYVPDVGEVVFYKPEITETGEPDFTVLPEGRNEPITHTRQKNGDGINAVKDLPFSTINLVNGEGVKSVKLDSGEGQKALSRYSASFGEESIAGILGYHFSNIDFENKIIALNDSTEKQSSVPTAEVNYANPKEFFVNWSVGDVICIINSSKHDLCSTITAINNNQITVNEFPFTKVNSMSAASIDYDDYSVFNPNAPTEGIVDLAPAAFVSGVENLSAGAGTHTEGKQNKSIGHYAHTEGRKTIATYNAHAEGYKTEARGQGTHTEGHETKGNGKAVHAEGYQTKALADYAHSEGAKTEATAESSHAEGNATQATARGTHSEGVLTKATNEAAHSEGRETEANGPYSHAGGHKAKAEGTCSFAHGDTVVAQKGQSVFGAHNETNPEALAQWGNGTAANPSNAFEILKDGSFNYKDPIEGYANSTDIRKKTVKAINDNYVHYQNTLKNNIDCNFELTRKEELGSGVIWDYYSEEQFISRDTNDQYYGNLNKRGELYNISSNLIIKENHGYNQKHGLKFDFRDDGGIYITGILDKEPDTQYVQFSLLDASGENTDFTKELIKYFIQNKNEKTLYLKLKPDNPNMLPTGTFLQISYKLTPESTTQYFNVKDNEVKFVELNETSELYSIYLQINISNVENGTEFSTLVYPYVSFGKEANERGQILTIPTEYNSYWALLKEGFLYCTELELVSFYKSKIATKEEVNAKAPVIHEHEIEDVNGLQEIVEQISNENNSFVQNGNEAIGESSASFGASNVNFSDYSFTEGLMNLAGVKLNNKVVLDAKSAQRYDAENGNRYTQIVLNTIDEKLASLTESDSVIIYANEVYYSCRFLRIENDTIYFLNHNAAGAISKAIDAGTAVELYIIDEASAATSCHTEHVEGAYNITAETGDGAKSSRVTHIEGHSNISFGQYNHIEGIQNRALNQTEFTHIEGRMNIVDPGVDGKVGTTHVAGEGNRIGVSSYSRIGGSTNTANQIRWVDILGQSNTVDNAKHSKIGGHLNLVSDVEQAIIHGSNLKASGVNKAVFGKFNKENADALMMFGIGTSNSNRKNAFEILSNGDIKYLNSQSELVSLNSSFANVENNANKIKQDLTDALETQKELTTSVQSQCDKIATSLLKEEAVSITENTYNLEDGAEMVRLKSYIVYGPQTPKGTYNASDYLSNPLNAIHLYDENNEETIIDYSLLNSISDYGMAYTKIDFENNQFINEGRTLIIDENSSIKAGTTGGVPFFYVAIVSSIAADKNNYIRDDNLLNTNVYKDYYMTGDGTGFRMFPTNTSMTLEEFKEELKERPLTIRYKYLTESNIKTQSLASYNVQNKIDVTNSVKFTIENQSNNHSLDFVTQSLYKIKVVEDGEEGTDENTLYFILE